MAAPSGSAMSATTHSTGISSFSPGFRFTRSSTGLRGFDDAMSMNATTRVPSAGIFVGPVAWATNQQLNYMLVPWICAHQIRLVPVIALVLAMVSLVGAYVSWRGYRSAGPAPAAGSP